jgi:hypothetical protein
VALPHFFDRYGEDTMNKVKLFFRMLFDNNALLKSNQFPLLLVLLLFLINVSLISVPNFYGLADSVRIINRLDGIYETLEEMYTEEMPCEVREEQMVCEETNLQESYGNYKIQYLGELDTEQVEESLIYLGKDYMAILYVEGETAYIMSGDYRLLEGFSFADVYPNESDLSEEDYPEYISDLFLQNIYYSNVGEQIYLVYTTQFAQTAIYVIMLSIMMLIVNYKAMVKKITYTASIKIVIVGMTGPALLTAILGGFILGYAGLVFILAYGLRMMFMYYKINKHEGTIY